MYCQTTVLNSRLSPQLIELRHISKLDRIKDFFLRDAHSPNFMELLKRPHQNNIVIAHCNVYRVENITLEVHYATDKPFFSCY